MFGIKPSGVVMISCVPEGYGGDGLGWQRRVEKTQSLLGHCHPTCRSYKAPTSGGGLFTPIPHGAHQLGSQEEENSLLRNPCTNYIFWWSLSALLDQEDIEGT